MVGVKVSNQYDPEEKHSNPARAGLPVRNAAVANLRELD